MTARYAHLRDDALKAASNVASEVFRPVENAEIAKINQK
jgi:hypothetical protein